MPADLSKLPHLQRLVDKNPAYHKAWLEGRFPPADPNTSEEETVARHGLTALARRWGYAVAKWVLAGRPKRTDEEVARLLAICQGVGDSAPCAKFDKGTCKICGCAVNRRRLAIANKLRMATESCPLKRW